MLYLIFYVVLLQLLIRYFNNQSISALFFSKVAAYRSFRNTGSISSGHLVRPRTFVIDLGDTREKLQALKLRTNNEYDDSEVASILDSTPLNSEVVRHWQDKAGNRKTVVFCSTIEHARHVTTAFKDHGIKAALVTSECSVSEREKILAAVTIGEIQVLINVAILTEGWELSACILRDTAPTGFL